MKNWAYLLVIHSVVGLSLIGLLGGCAGDRVKYDSSTHTETAVNGKDVDMSVEWLKNKSDGIDALAWLNNETTHYVFTGDDSFHLLYKGQSYSLRKGHTDAGVVSLAPGERKKVLLLFELDKEPKRTGEVAIVLNPLFEGRIGDANPKKLAEMKLNLPLEIKK